MRIENFPKLKRSDHSPKPDEFIDVSLDPSYFSLDSPFNIVLNTLQITIAYLQRWKQFAKLKLFIARLNTLYSFKLIYIKHAISLIPGF
jgi:hypothetical protein